MAAMMNSPTEQMVKRSYRAPVCGVLFAMLAAVAGQPARAESLQWSDRDGVVWTNPIAVVHVDRGEGQVGPLLRVGADGQSLPLGKPVVAPSEKEKLRLVYTLAM